MFSYTYRNDQAALTNLQSIFSQIFGGAGFISDPIASFYFFKMQDVHQMLASAASLPDSFLPGGEYVIPSHEAPVLSGKFIGGPATYIYVQTTKGQNGRIASVRVTNLRNQFSTDAMTTFTNFTFSMNVALDGPRQGLLISGEGQETAYINSVWRHDCQGTFPAIFGRVHVENGRSCGFRPLLATEVKKHLIGVSVIFSA